jgi:hypothetical protein
MADRRTATAGVGLRNVDTFYERPWSPTLFRRDRLDTAFESNMGMMMPEVGMIPKCCARVCPEHIHITDDAIIPLKEHVVDRFYDPPDAAAAHLTANVGRPLTGRHPYVGAGFSRPFVLYVVFGFSRTAGGRGNSKA